MSARYLVATTPGEVLALAAATRAGVLEPQDRVLVVGRGPLSAAARRCAEALDLAEEVVVLDELLDTRGRLEDGAVELVVGTASVEAGRALARRLPDLTVTLLAVDAAAYGPTPELVRGRFARLVTRVVHLDLVPAAPVLLLSERAVAAVPVDPGAYRAVLADLPSPGPVEDPTTLVVARSAAWGGTLDAEQQTTLVTAMLQRCAEVGHSRLLVLVDPGTRPRVRKALEKAAKQSRADLTVVDDALPVEQWLATGAVRRVVGCAAPELLVAQTVLGLRAAQLDTDLVLKRLSPFSEPQRVPAALVQATVPDLRSWTATPEGEAPRALDLAGLTTSVAYAMQPELLAGRRGEAIAFLDATKDDVRRRYVRRRRLGELRLPGGKRKVRPTLS